MTDPSKININGWQQGSALPDLLTSELGPAHVSDWTDGSVLVVLTQDCDLVHASYDTEPNVELIAGELVDVADNGLRFGRNPRRVHLDIQGGGQAGAVAFSIHRRIVVPRRVLEDHSPHAVLRIAPDQRRILCEWIAKRYLRAAFPDAFNERTHSSYRKIEKALKQDGACVTGLFLAITPDDDSTEQDYRVALRVVARSDSLADQKIELTLVRLAKVIADALGACKGVVVEDHALVSEAEFTLEDLRFFKRWDWDYRSHSGEPGGEIVSIV